MDSQRDALVPVTMLSGFLGAGKTTLLRYVLKNGAGIKIGCIVNDVAAVNIDAKLIRNDRTKSEGSGAASSTADLADTIELANGCVCCSIQDELFMSVQQLLDGADKKGDKFDRIILENSGVAEPQNIRDKFAEAIAEGHPATARVRLDTLVTVVDSSTFIRDYSSRTPLSARPDLGEGGGFRPVVDLLVEQIECADFIVLNKIDALKPGQLDTLNAIVKSLNPLAQVVQCEYGEVDMERVFGRDSKPLMSHLNIEGQHRGAVAAALEAQMQKEGRSHVHDDSCEHEHCHDHKHEHGHKHDHKHEHGHDHKHAHDHEHDHKHDHGHDHDHKHEHGHDHGHKHERQETSAANRFGIRSFVYRKRRPFNPQRLRELVLRWLPVAHNKALGGAEPEAGDSPIKTVLRSKGFTWMANNHATAFYWSHAGQHFEIRDEGDWWAAVPEEDWPTAPEQCEVVLADFDIDTPWGDRRQEIVFIGANMDEAAIRAQLDGALLNDEEMARYEAAMAATPDPSHPALEQLKTAKRAKLAE